MGGGSGVFQLSISTHNCDILQYTEKSAPGKGVRQCVSACFGALMGNFLGIAVRILTILFIVDSLVQFPYTHWDRVSRLKSLMFMQEGEIPCLTAEKSSWALSSF